MLRWLKRHLAGPKASVTGRKSDLERGELRERLEEILGFPPTSLDSYLKALRHRSIIDDDRYEKHETYERLEFLGDAVLDLIVTEVIFSRFPSADEGFMTKLRAKLVKGDTLYRFAHYLELNEILEVGDRARGQGIELSKSVLADVFEAVTAAVYLTEGYEKTYQFIESVLDSTLDLNEVSTVVDNYKSELLEYTQATGYPLPRYRVISESGPGHDKTFEVAVSVGQADYGSGVGKSKKEAEQLAAREAYSSLKRLDLS
jgi:ribonuclease III